MQQGNIFANMPDDLSSEVIETLHKSASLRIERIISSGQSTPEGEWYDQLQDEWVLLLSGSAGLMFESEACVRTLKAGDYVMIPARCRHRVAWTDAVEKTVWLAVHIEKDAERLLHGKE